MSIALRWSETDRDRLRRHLPEAVVIIPVGATEQHGPHLPTSTDTLIAAAVADGAATAAAGRSDRPLIVAPAIDWGASDHHLPYGGTLSLSPETLLAVICDLFRSIAAQGGRRVVLLNGHGGNVGVCHAAAAAGSTRFDLSVAHLDYWRLADTEGEPPVPGHAGEFETSMVLALRPGLVGPRAPRPQAPEVVTVQGVDLHSGAVWRRIDGFTDRPELAQADEGKRRLEDLVGRAADRLVELAGVL
ncbi:creatininase family protein [Streptosporangium sp. NBC_01755]|uniref:creatininase family protein n=1 Tax=unclassified Streptosporangium TaxID=2632669 RepID=UPI002DDA2D31|nr:MULTISPECIES: creatininase family protein [unclassified Streptosporangium]WSA28393.1 creatininase family protein [Streptosporangium sp. NBC_01810]WSD00117.1 creatininase family protein [Streptosporangium sp. NBC_01755]